MESCEGKSVEAVYPEIYAVPDTGSTAIPAAPSTADPPTYVLDVSDPSVTLIFRKNASRLPPNCLLTAPVMTGKSTELVTPATYRKVESVAIAAPDSPNVTLPPLPPTYVQKDSAVPVLFRRATNAS